MLRRKGSLKTKVICVILFITLLMMGASIFVGYFLYAKAMDDHYKMLVVNIGKTTAAMMDGDKIEQYVETQKLDEEYDVMLDKLFQLRDSNGCKFLYIQTLEYENGVVRYVMDADAPDNAYQFGETEVINDVFMDVVATGAYKTVGIAPEINYTKSNGWLCSGYQPILNSKGEFVAQVGTDISMDEIMNDRYRFLLMLVLTMGTITVFSILVAYRLTSKNVITPLSLLTAATSDFVSDKGDNEQKISKISQLNIKSNDEVETLTCSIKQMEHDINQYIDNLQKVTAEKERIGAELNVARSI